MMTFSVRFYKRLILVILALLILIPTVLAIRFGVQNSTLKRQLAGEIPVPTQAVVPSADPVGLEGEAIEYQLLYPELYSRAKVPAERTRNENTVYLTFDCSPGDNTGRILDILNEYDVKATFFLSGSSDPAAPALMKRIADEGHTVGVGSYSNSYQTAYHSVSAYLDDFSQIYNVIHEATGVKAEIFRFPGGSVNAYNSGIYQELIAEMLRRGFVFFDWNVSGEDTRIGDQSADRIKSNVVSGMDSRDRGVVLLRDSIGKDAVVNALSGIIEELRGEGYTFAPLTADVMPVIFSYKSAP